MPARRATALLDSPPKKRARDRGRAGVIPARRATARSEYSPRPGRFTRAMRCNAGRKAGSRCRLRSRSKVESKIRLSCLPGHARFSIRRPLQRSCNGGSGRKWSMASRCRLARFRKSGLRCPSDYRSSGFRETPAGTDAEISAAGHRARLGRDPVRQLRRRGARAGCSATAALGGAPQYPVHPSVAAKWSVPECGQCHRPGPNRLHLDRHPGGSQPLQRL